MKKIYILSILIFICFVSCKEKKQNCVAVKPSLMKTLKVEFDDTVLADHIDNLEYRKVPKLSRMQYDSLQLEKVIHLKDYDPSYLSVNRFLYKNENGEIYIK